MFGIFHFYAKINRYKSTYLFGFMEIKYRVILNEVKNLYAFAGCMQILRFAQDDTGMKCHFLKIQRIAFQESNCLVDFLVHHDVFLYKWYFVSIFREEFLDNR